MIGIFGGSFNPIHYGHINIARDLLALSDSGESPVRIEEIWFVVSPQNPLKRNTDLWDDDLRYSLVEKALAPYPRLKPCDVEFCLPKPSYMWHTLETLRQENPGKRLILLIGADNWLSFHRWHRHEDILRDFEIGVYPRPGYTVSPDSLPSNVHYLPTGLYDISSTEIRRRIAEGESLEDLRC